MTGTVEIQPAKDLVGIIGENMSIFARFQQSERQVEKSQLTIWRFVSVDELIQWRRLCEKHWLDAHCKLQTKALINQVYKVKLTLENQK